MKRIMSRNKKNNILLIFMVMYIFIYIFLLFKNSLQYLESINASFSICLCSLGVLLLGFRRKVNHENKRHILKITLGILFLYFLITYGVGLSIGFLKNSYSLKITSIIDNTFNVFVSIIFIELFRFVFVSANEDKKSYIVLFTILLTIVEVLLLVKMDSFNTIINAYNFIALTIMPILIKNIMCTYLNWHGDYKASLCYRLIMDLYFYVVPIQPDFNELINGILLMILPFIIILFCSKYTDVDIKNEYSSSKKMFKLSDMPALIILVCFASMVFGFGPFSLVGIETGSMTPNINVGDAVLVNKMYNTDNLKIGDIIAFYNNDSVLVIHRIIGINSNGTYITKGDYNNSADEGYIKKENVVGKVMFKIPYLAYPTILFKEQVYE